MRILEGDAGFRQLPPKLLQVRNASVRFNATSDGRVASGFSADIISVALSFRSGSIQRTFKEDSEISEADSIETRP